MFDTMKLAALFTLLAAAVANPAGRRRDPMMNPGLTEGDLLGVERSKNRNAIPLDSQRWPGGEIPYTVDKSLEPRWHGVIRKGMAHISSKTCIRFVERTTEQDYVKIFKGNGCYSFWGRIGGEQELSLGFGCYDLGTVVHELMHAVGFEHEHNRSDRDDYLEIHWDNIDKAFEDAFEPLMPHEERLLTDFDFDSIMLYGSEAFSKEFGLKTMEALDGRFMPEVYHKKGLSQDDVRRVNMLYDCPTY